MGEALGQLYVEKHFPPAAKQRMDELVKNLMAAYRERIETRDWMGDETKKLALAKLQDVTPKIGYPDKWRDYSDLESRHDDSYAENVMRAEAFESRYSFDQTGKPVDRTRVAHDAAHRERLLQLVDERDRLSRRHFAAAVF